MFARFFLLMLSFISLAWIIFIGYDLLDQKDNVSPQHIFSEIDGEILIINRSSEVHIDELNYTLNSEFKELFSQLLQNVYASERIYISEKRPLIIIETPNIWTKHSVQKYFETKGIKIPLPEKNKFQIQSNLTCFYKKNHLLITKNSSYQWHKEIEWPLWDNKASASIIHLSHPLKSTNIYFKGNGSISYQTKYGPKVETKKIDDADLFSQFLPANCDEYHFLEKEYAVNTNILNTESPLYQWMEDGMVMFSYQGVKCILSDYNKSIDPINILRNDQDSEAETELTNKFKGINLLKSFPKNSNSGFYIGKLADKVILSEKKETLEKVIAEYQLGNTLALDQEKFKAIFDKMPKKVSERNLNAGKTYSLTSYKNLLIKTQIYSAENEDETKEIRKEVKTNNSFVFASKLKLFLGNSTLLYAISADNEIIAISNKKQIWKQKLEGEIIGNPKLIDIYENGNLQLLLNTSEKVYLFSADGSKVNEFPLAAKASNAVSFYRWNNKANFLLVNTNNELLQIDQNGRIVRKLKLNFSGVKNEIDVFKNGKILTAIVSGESKSQHVDLDRNKGLKLSVILPKERLQLKTSSSFAYFEVKNNQVVRTDLNGNKKTIYAGKEIKNLKKLYKGEQQILCFQDKNTVIIINEEGNLSQKVSTKTNEIEDFDVITASNGTTYLAIIDGIENNIFIYNSSGALLSEKSFEGKASVKLSDEQGKLTLSTLIEGYIVQYYDILSPEK
jgi:hypothetical protein